jgi:formate hydrogenlyase subunit 6/NADH:ubiquinone oxidoreductase subunit I
VIFATLLKQLVRRPATNPFPVKYMPRSVTGLLGRVAEGKASIHPPVPVPPDLRGKIAYDAETCIGCQLCVRVCPARVIEFLPETKKIRMYVARCTFCAQCVDVCPVGALATTTDFLLADADRFSENLIVEPAAAIGEG